MHKLRAGPVATCLELINDVSLAPAYFMQPRAFLTLLCQQLAACLLYMALNASKIPPYDRHTDQHPQINACQHGIPDEVEGGNDNREGHGC